MLSRRAVRNSDPTSGRHGECCRLSRACASFAWAGCGGGNGALQIRQSHTVRDRIRPKRISMTRREILKNAHSQLRSDFHKLTKTTNRVASLPRFFRATVTLDRAKEEIWRLLDNRNETFLSLMQDRIYENRSSPYLRLLKFVGCEFADFRYQVNRNGVERTLEQLAAEGAYLTSDEFKGKKDVVRGNFSFKVSPGDFELSASH